MMLGLHHAGLNKGISNVIVTVIMIAIAITAVVIFWTATKKIIMTSPEFSCIDLISSFGIEDACYLSGYEIKVSIKRGFDNLNIGRMRFAFSDNIWEITGKKCSDVRSEDGNYGGYCELLRQGESKSYVFNISDLGKKEEVVVGVGSKELCDIGEMKIRQNC